MKKILVGLISNFEYIKEIVPCFLLVLLVLLLLNFLQVESVRHLRALATGPCLPHEMKTNLEREAGLRAARARKLHSTLTDVVTFYTSLGEI